MPASTTTTMLKPGEIAEATTLRATERDCEACGTREHLLHTGLRVVLADWITAPQLRTVVTMSIQAVMSAVEEYQAKTGHTLSQLGSEAEMVVECWMRPK